MQTRVIAIAPTTMKTRKEITTKNKKDEKYVHQRTKTHSNESQVKFHRDPDCFLHILYRYLHNVVFVTDNFIHSFLSFPYTLSLAVCLSVSLCLSLSLSICVSLSIAIYRSISFSHLSQPEA